jgi:hypothetical protein
MMASDVRSIDTIDTIDGRQTRAGLEEWVLRMPWVVERPDGFAPGVRVFGVDCEPINVRRVWLVTGMGDAGPDGDGVAVILPNYVARFVEELGWAWTAAPLPVGHVLMKASSFADPREIEALVRTAYDCALPSVPRR